LKEQVVEINKRIGSIAKVGAELFSSKGFVETSMDHVSSAAKLSKGGIYHYFPSKTELLNFIVDQFMDIVLKDLEEDLESIEDPFEKLKRLIFRHVDLYSKHRFAAKTLLNEAHNLPVKSRKRIIAKEREYFRIVAALLSDYFGPSLEKNRVTAITFSLLGMCNWIYSWYNPRGPIDPEQLSQIIFDIFIGGVPGFQKKKIATQAALKGGNNFAHGREP